MVINGLDDSYNFEMFLGTDIEIWHVEFIVRYEVIHVLLEGHLQIFYVLRSH